MNGKGSRERALTLAALLSSLVMISVVVTGASQFLPSSTINYGSQAAAPVVATVVVVPPKPEITHIQTPSAVKAVYMTACIASEAKYRNRMMDSIYETEINSIVIDIKDYTGTLAYASTSVKAPKSKRGCKIYDLKEFIKELHEKEIYVIARITVFQDPLYAEYRPDLAVASISNDGKPWRDKNGLAYIDPNYSEYWKYIVEISKEAYSIGFDEINFDYIRFPTDGIMADASFATPEGETRVSVMTKFFSYLHSELAPLGIVTSADIFGQTTVNKDDLGIGQVLENILPYFDYVAPMVYPSHFINGFMGYEKPAKFPYEVISGTMALAVDRAIAASSSPDKLRPWLQAFDYRAIYTPEMVRLQIQGTYDAGLTSWMLWDPANRYNREALIPTDITVE